MAVEQNPFEGSFDSIEALAEAINDVLGCPVTIEDVNHRLIAYSSHDPHMDTARIATIVGRRVPEKVIGGLWRDGVIQRLAESDDPVRVPAIREIGLNDRVAVAIRKNTELLGYIWVVEDENHLDEQQLQQLKKAAQAARAKLIQHHQQRRKEEEGHKDFFWQLLMGHLQSETAIEEKAAKLGVALPSSFHILILQFASEISDKTVCQIRNLAAAAQHLKPVFHAIDRNQFILLSTPRFRHSSMRDFTNALAGFLRQMNDQFGSALLHGGSGSLYEDYTKVEKSYQEALTVLRIKTQFPGETSRLHYYPDLGYYRFLPLILEEKEKRGYRNICLEKLREYDREHNGDLLRTLEVFLGCDSNSKLAADALHVHTNTMNYRLKRISEIGDIDLTDMDQKVTLYLDLKTERLGRS
ncbi:PucR family transcriptional regulator [Paenibacillus beijingensis]|uniref:PucR family transcriptional regulator n=1 Tax=Paenibacillus beijingensis TaxID=1126833 RepID=A0A0D5NHK3_9BACL|nr:helix-turn-helix domain-containing protein [Paenibacillus beijingensis]AJY74398.1 PucR family transcriptional regulator [Paenibacillus beijingensis]